MEIKKHMKQFSWTGRFLASKKTNAESQIQSHGFDFRRCVDVSLKVVKNVKLVVTCSRQAELCRNSRRSLGLPEASLNGFLLVFLSTLKGGPVLGHLCAMLTVIIVFHHLSNVLEIQFSLLFNNDKPLMLWITAFTVRCNRKILQRLNFICFDQSPGMMTV